jgi:hypothetical protein
MPDEDVFLTQPEHVNEFGVKFWQHETGTSYARGKGLNNVIVYAIEEASGRRSILICQYNEDDTGETVFENPSFEAVCVRLDIMGVWKS